MPEPETTLDARYSAEGATAVPWSEVRQALEDAPLFWITTVRPDGRPHSTPLVAVWLDDALHFATGAEEQKGRNLAANPHVLLTTGDSRWDDGLDIVVEGDAERATGGRELRQLADAWKGKWDGRWQFGVGDGVFLHMNGSTEAQVYRVAPTTVWAFGKNAYTHTRYQF